MSAQHHRTALVNAMHLKDILRDIQTNRANLFHAVAPLLRFLAPASWHPKAPGEKPSTASKNEVFATILDPKINASE